MIPLTVVAKKALHEALSFGLPGGSSFGGLGRLGGMDTGGDPLMNWSRTKRPLGSLEIPSGSVEDTQDAFSGTLQRMGYKSSIDPETGKEQLFAPRKETTKKLEQSPVSFSGGRGQSVRRPEQMPSATSQSAQPQKEDQARLAVARRQMEAENEAMMRRELGDKKYNEAEQRKQKGDDLKRMNPEIASKSVLAQSRRAADVVATNTQKEIEELDKNEEQLKVAGKSSYEISQMRKALVDKQRANQGQNVQYDEKGNVVTLGSDFADEGDSTMTKIRRGISDVLGIEQQRKTTQIRDAKSGFVPSEYRLPAKK